MKIEVNNGRAINLTDDRGYLKVEHLNSDGTVDGYPDYYSEGEIVMALNLLSYMKQDDRKSVYLLDESGERYFGNCIRNGDLEEFRIFQ